MFYKLNGKTPILCTAQEMGEWMENNCRTLACDSYGTLTISTIFLGVDHSKSADPLVFETAVFIKHEHIDVYRYYTWEEAEKGHREMIKKHYKK